MLARTGQRIALSTGRAALPRCSRWVRHASESASEGFEAGMGREERQYEKAGRKVYLRDTKAKASPGIKFPQRDIFPYKPADLAKKDLEQHGFGNELPSSPNENYGAARPHTDNSPAAQAARRDIADPKQKATTDPYILGPRLMNIYKYVGRAMAVTELANAKKEAKTVPVHNMLIQMLLREGQVDLAFRVWMDVGSGNYLHPARPSLTPFAASLR